MPADLIYDIENLRTAKKAIDDLVDDLDSSNADLTLSLGDLEKAWQTPAGEKFFQDHKNTWSVYVTKYSRKLRGVSSMLNKAITEYEGIANEVKNLKI